MFPQKSVSLVQFIGKDGENFDIQCSPSGFDREGELMLSLFYNKTVIARLTFSVILTQNGHIAFIGGLQEPLKIPDLMLFGAQPGPVMGFSQNGLFLKHFVR